MAKFWIRRCAYCGELLDVTECTDLTAPPVTPSTNHFIRHHGQPSEINVVVVYAPTKEHIL